MCSNPNDEGERPMTKTIKGISAGFVATAVLSMIMVAKGMMAPAMTLTT
jgi:hypothetical protein